MLTSHPQTALIAPASTFYPQKINVTVQKKSPAYQKSDGSNNVSGDLPLLKTGFDLAFPVPILYKRLYLLLSNVHKY